MSKTRQPDRPRLTDVGTGGTERANYGKTTRPKKKKTIARYQFQRLPLDVAELDVLLVFDWCPEGPAVPSPSLKSEAEGAIDDNYFKNMLDGFKRNIRYIIYRS